MINENFVILGALFSLIGTASYIYSTLKGRTKPNRVTWFLWALAPLIAFSAMVGEGVGISSLMTFMVGFGPLLVFLVSFVNRKSVWRLTKFDLICGALSLAGLGLWAITKDAGLAIIFSITADGLALLPTLVKAWRRPETENYVSFLGGASSAFITMLTLKEWTLATAGFPIYIFVACALMVFVIKFKPGKKLKPVNL